MFLTILEVFVTDLIKRLFRFFSVMCVAELADKMIYLYHRLLLEKLFLLLQLKMNERPM